MSDFILTKDQYYNLKNNLISENKIELAKHNWQNMSENEKQLVLKIVEHLYPKKHKVLKEAWWNTVMDVIGLVDPTPIVDTINAISYFIQGDTLFGILSIISAIPYAGDVVAKPVTGALKVGSVATKELKAALDLAKVGKTVESQAKLVALAKQPGPVGKFLRSAGGPGGWATKVNKFLDEIPFGVFKGMKKTIMDYFTLLGNAGTKSKQVASLLSTASRTAKPQDIQKVLDVIKTTKVFDPKTLSKPGILGQIFGGIPRLFRSPEGRRLKIMMMQTKWWLGFLDYIGLGNWVGVDEAIKQLGGEKEFYDKLNQYQQTPEAKQNFDDSFEGELSQQQYTQQTQSSGSQSSGDPLSNFFRKLFLGQINPVPGM